MSTSRKLTNPLRPAARYRKGQAPAGVPLSDSDEDEQPQSADADQPPLDEPISEEDEDDVKPSIAGGRKAGGAMKVSLREVEVDTQGQVRVGGRTEVGRTAQESSEGEYETDEDEQSAGLANKPGGARAAARPDEVSRATRAPH